MKYMRRLACALGALLSAAAAQAQENAVAQDVGSTAPEASALPAETEPGVDAAAAKPEAGPGVTQTRARTSLLEEIVVTAQKRSENLSNVPISLQAFSPEALASRGIESQVGLTRAVPSLDVGSQAGYATIFLRGVGTEAFLTADPSIASYVDGVYFPFSPTFIQDFAGIDHLEVLKGPQGTLFGRNAVGGAISVTNKAPDFTKRETDIDVTAGRYGLFKPRLYTNVPVTDNFAVNLSAYLSNSDSYLKGTTGGKPLREENSQGIRVKTRWAPLDELEIAFGWTRTRNEGNGAIGQNLHPSLLGRTLGITPPADKRSIDVDEHLYGVAETRVLSTQITYNAPWLDIKLLGSKQHDSLLYNYDFDGSPQPYVSFDVPGHPADIRQGELQLISNKGMPWSDSLDLTGGVFLFHNIQGFNPVDVTVANFDPTAPGSVLANLPGLNMLPSALTDQLATTFGPNGLLAGLAGGVLPPGRAYRVRAVARIETSSAGYYLQSTYRFTDWAALTLGGRYQNEERGVYKSTITLLAAQTDVGQTLINGPLITWNQARDADNNLVPNHDRTKGFFPKVTMDFHPFLDETLVFASWQRAKKASAYNAFAIYLPPQYIKPETTTAYELGLRTPLFDGNVKLNVAAFRYDIKDLQTQYVSLLSGGALAFQNAPEATSKGIDFDIAAQILPSVIDGLGLSLNGAFIDAKFGSYPHAAGYSTTTGLFSPDNDFSGNRQTRTPKFSGTVALTKLWALDTSEFEIGSNYYYNSGFFYSASNDPNYEQSAYGLIGAFARYQYDPWKLQVRAYGNNLANKFYTQGVISTDFGGVFTVAPPTEYGVTVSWSF